MWLLSEALCVIAFPLHLLYNRRFVEEHMEGAGAHIFR